MTDWRKAIPEHRDKLQSRILVWTVGPLLAGACLPLMFFMASSQNSGPFLRIAFGLSLTFGLIVWALRAGTGPAAFCGATICFLAIARTGSFPKWPVASGLAPMMSLFILTFLTTRAGKHQKLSAGLAENPRGRRAAQVIANIGASGLVVISASFGLFDRLSKGSGILGFSAFAGPAMLLAVFAEATADTVASEIGQAFGGQPFMLWTNRRVPPGTDGAITILGTAAGLVGAAIVVLTGTWSMHLAPAQALAALLGGSAGLFCDSLLGATVERRGWLGNDLVNFSSTVFAAAVALALLALR